MPSVRRTAEEFSEKEGVSLNQFINVAVAKSWPIWNTRNGRVSENTRTKELAAWALNLLYKARNKPVEPGRRIAEGLPG